VDYSAFHNPDTSGVTFIVTAGQPKQEFHYQKPDYEAIWREAILAEFGGGVGHDHIIAEHLLASQHIKILAGSLDHFDFPAGNSND
jgi:hypothetical protein